MKKYRYLAAAFLAELLLILFLGLLYYFQIANEKSQLINQTMVVVQFYAHQPTPFQASFSHFFYEYGYPSLTSLFINTQSPKTDGPISEANLSQFAILMEADILKSQDQHLRQAYLNPRANQLQEYGDNLALSSVLYREPSHAPYGMVRITHNVKYLPRDVFFKNALLYLVILLLYNSQLFLLNLYWQQRKKQNTVYLEQGYLKEHAIGALKLQYRILGDIIADHENVETAPEEHGEKSDDDKRGRIIILERPRTNKDGG